jgi:serine/threonine protein kinase
VAEETVGGYRLQNLMMTGQTSQVWEVVELSSGRHFAMKLLLPEKAREAQHRAFLLHEAAVGKKLAHPNIIRIIEVIPAPRNPYFVMEFFPSGSLKVRMTAGKAGRSPTKSQEDFIREHTPSILKQTATALAYMNASGWVHRDVKPDNILVNSAGDVRIIDFALAIRVERDSFFKRLFRRKRKVQGTRSYMSPEQIRGQPLDGRADVYSFGASAFEIVTGRPPFRAVSSQELLAKHITERAVSPQTYNPDVTDEFGALVVRMLAKKKEERPRDFHEVLMKLRTMKVFKSETASVKPDE